MNNIDELRKIINDLPHEEKWPDCNHIEGGKYSHRLPLVHSLTDITTIIEQADRIAELKSLLDNGLKAAVRNADRIAELERVIVNVVRLQRNSEGYPLALDALEAVLKQAGDL